MKSFYLKSITIDERCDKELRKALMPGVYKLADALPFDMYGSKISVSAIVGKNGAGKSSLLDILFRIVNNLSYVLIAHTSWRRAAEPLFYIRGMYVSIEYVIDGKDCQLECKGSSVGIRQGETKYYFTEEEKTDPDYEEKGYKLIIKPNQKLRKEILKDFFFTVVTNYSLQAFNSNDYNEENSFHVIKGEDRVPHGNWMDSVFNKNDGYMMPLTFNPYRYRGQIDIENETKRTTTRLSAILIQAKKKSREVLEGYQLDDIYYAFDESAICKKIPYNGSFMKTYEAKEPSDIYKLAKEALENSFSFLRIILDTWKYTFAENNTMQNNVCIYLCNKVLSIAAKYPKYDDYAELGHQGHIFKIANPSQKELLLKLLDDIDKDNSHITTKVNQTRNFLDALKEGKHIDRVFTYSEYERFVTHDKIKNRSVEGYMGILPPPIFRPDIFFNHTDRGKSNKNEQILLTHLSSGERQFLYMMSTLIYHVINIKSVPTSREYYRHINLVLDEIEICFHPEYQRKMVSWLVSAIQRLRLNTFCSFNIILTTHSPFILSDMIPENILYLKGGEVANAAVSKKLPTPLAANVNDILKQSFFLEEGFIGEQAKNSIMELIRFLQSTRPTYRHWDKGKAKKFIDRIGEPLLKEHMMELWRRKQ